MIWVSGNLLKYCDLTRDVTHCLFKPAKLKGNCAEERVCQFGLTGPKLAVCVDSVKRTWALWTNFRLNSGRCTYNLEALSILLNFSESQFSFPWNRECYLPCSTVCKDEMKYNYSCLITGPAYSGYSRTQHFFVPFSFWVCQINGRQCF